MFLWKHFTKPTPYPSELPFTHELSVETSEVTHNVLKVLAKHMVGQSIHSTDNCKKDVILVYVLVWRQEIKTCKPHKQTNVGILWK